MVLTSAAFAATTPLTTTAPAKTTPSTTTPTTPSTTTPTTPSTTTPSTTTTTPTTTTQAPNPAVHFRWNKPVRIEPTRLGGVNAVSCPTTTLCIAVDQSGNVLFNTRPLHNRWSGRAWIDPNTPLTGISCPTPALCVAIDADGRVLTSTKPTGGLHAWSKAVKVDPTAAPGGGSVGLRGISCPTPQLCVAVDGAPKGNILVSTNPAGGPSAWSLQPVASGPLTSIACPSTTVCVAAGAERYVSTTPTGGARSWRTTGSQLGGGVFSAIACPSITTCVATGFGNTSIGLVSASSTPVGSAASWTTVGVAAAPPVPGAGLLDAIGCPKATLCVAIDGSDNAYASTSPVAGTWGTQTPIRPSSASYASAIACTPSFCMVVDSAGVETTAIVH